MSTPLDSRAKTRARTVRFVSLGIVVAAGAGLVGLTPFSGQPADAVEVTSSELTVKWTGAGQPTRDPSSPHFAEMKDLSISVSQTSGIVDQAIRVKVAGFAVGQGTLPSPSSDVPVDNAMNFLQAMQCWGDPSDKDFRQTCQWGGRYVENNGLGNSVYFDNTLRVSTTELDSAKPDPQDNPFRTAQGRLVSGIKQDIAGETKYEILDYFNPATSNEVQSARVGVDGTGSFDFETQTADQAPQLGCGTPEQITCYLVIVPRGTVYGGDRDKCSQINNPLRDFEDPDPASTYYAKGAKNAIQGGSPVSLGCDYWDNRVVVPLTFAPVGATCAVGSSEQRVVGSQLMVGAMSSWQPDLCARLKATYSFSTNPDSVARAQLLEGTATAAFMGLPLSPGEFDSNDDRQVLADTQLAYAPVAISGVTIGYLAESTAARQSTLNLSPRLVAKLLTQSYVFQIPANSGDFVAGRTASHLPAQNRTYRFFKEDPEFQKLNPTNFNSFTQNPGIVLPGPAGADAIKQVWRWIAADAEAVSFLNGTPDPWGMAVNPYYLPAGDARAVVPTFDGQGNFITANGANVTKAVGLANIDGSPLKIAESGLDSFIKADRTLAPLTLQTGQKFRFDSIQFAPYTENLLSGARQAFRADPNSKSTWDPTKINPAGEIGDWVSSGAQIPGSKFMIVITDSPSAARYGLDTAALQVPNSQKFVAPDRAGFTEALAALAPTSLPKVVQVDPAKVTGAGYPLTTVTYAAANLSRSTAANRVAIANLINQVTTTGQTAGTSVGQLPTGYLPLTDAMKAQAAAAVAEIRAFVPPAEGSSGNSSTPTNGPAQDSYEGGSLPTLDDQAAIADDAPASAEVTPGVDVAAEGRTAETEAAALTRGGLAASLGFGLLGSIFGPILFRGRGLA